ncbi:hypothetical protein SRABI134_04140 [Peribacillus sp. Bi134]|nr:hypothetical protein SRABI134_04140 [Peribacillus sp. Bi134]
MTKAALKHVWRQLPKITTLFGGLFFMVLDKE